MIDLDRINDDSVIVDAGACIGRFIDAIRNYKEARNCRIIAIEPNRNLVKLLRGRGYLNVKIYEKAFVGQESEDKVLFHEILGLNGWGSIIRPRTWHPKCRGVDSYDVEALRINDIFNKFGIDKIDFLKLDIEGAEEAIFKTMTQKTASRIGQLSVEVHFKNLIGMGLEETEKLLSGLGFATCIVLKSEVYASRSEGGK